MHETLAVSAHRQRGFTLVEVSVSLFVTVIILLGVLALFDFSNRLSHVQTNVADMQQSLRVAQTDVVRLIRMAGRGGLPLGVLPAAPNAGWALAVGNNVTDPTWIAGNGTPEVVPGSDILTVRGVSSTPIYQINVANPAAFTLAPAAAPVGGTIQVSSLTPTGIPQDLSALKDAIDNKRPEALLLVSPRDAGIWAVVELDFNASATGADPYTVAFRISGGTNTTAYGNFSSAGAGVFPPQLTNTAYVAILEEHRFYLRREFSVPGVKTSDLAPKLSRARVYPGTNSPWGADVGNLRLDIADNIFDLQVALGFDSKLTADEVNGALSETADGEGDDWMYNGEAVPAAPAGDLRYVRLSTLARTDRRDPGYRAPLLLRVEDHTYPTTSPFNSNQELMYRRRILRTIIDMRNLG